MKRTHIHRNPLAMLMPVPKAVRDRLMTRAYSALDAIARGEHPGESEWRDLADVVNVVETLAIEMKSLPALALAYTETASQSLREAARRFNDTKTVRLDAAGLTALRGLLEIYGQCLETMTERHMERAFARTKEAIEQKLRDGAEAVTL
jgi:hypothetical protein